MQLCLTKGYQRPVTYNFWSEQAFDGVNDMQLCIRTVLQAGVGEYEEKRSRFLSRVYPVVTEEEALLILAGLKKNYWDARHHCYAYIIDAENPIQRFSDDGEPSGTAGVPILEAIRKKELTNTLVVVIRYFGGVLLGASGLVRAYGKAASAGLDNARVVISKLCLKTIIHIDYHIYGKLQNFLAGNQFPIIDTRFTESVEVMVYTEPDRKEFFEKSVFELTGGKCEISYQEKKYVNFNEDGICNNTKKT
jgi:uncharacterized YigZ family protein